ncbi:MAG: ComEC/Rec2 family competence protein [Acidobacteriota bacterium]
MKINRKTIAIVGLLALVALFFYQRCAKKPTPEPQPGPVTGKLVVRFLDIGQGDAQLLQLPGGETILIDSGDRGKPTTELLKQFGVSEIDLIIATHPHADHIGEMRDVMRAFKVKEFWDAGFTKNATKTYTEMLSEIKQQGIKFAAPKRGETRKFGDVLLEVLNPSTTIAEDDTNNSSIVARVTFGAKRFLFTGDAEVGAWKQMIETEKEKLRADVLKAAHHGSSNGTTREVLDVVRPAIFTISCAVANDYHHPHPRVVSLLQRERNIQVFRTDLQGTITAICDGENIEMSSEKPVEAARLYMTGDEVAGKASSGDEGGSMNSGGRGRRSK